MAKRSKGIHPAPIYQAHLSDGSVYRLSFFSPKNKPIDFEAGRRAAEEILLTDYDPSKVEWLRAPDGTWRGRWARLPLQIVQGFVQHPSFGMLNAPGRKVMPVLVEHKPGAAAPVVELPKRKRATRKVEVAAAAPSLNPALFDTLRYVRGLAADIREVKPGANGRTRAAWIVKACDDALAKAGEIKEAA